MGRLKEERLHTPISGILTGKKYAKQYTANLVLIFYIRILMILFSLLFNRWDFYVVFSSLFFLPLQLHRHAVVVVNFITTFKRILPCKCRHFVMSSSLLSKGDTVTKCRRFVRTKLRQSNVTLPIVDDKYSFTRARSALVELISSIESLEPSSYWYNISDNGIGSLCELFRLEECVFLSIMRTCGLIRQKITGGKSSYSIEHLKWDVLLSQYELRNVEISTSKLAVIGYIIK